MAISPPSILSPRDYHRIHMPVVGRCSACMGMCLVRCFRSASTTARRGLFARNERVVCILTPRSAPYGPGAGGADCRQHGHRVAWSGESTTHRPATPLGTIRISKSRCARAMKWVVFARLSTVVLLFARESASWLSQAGLERPMRLGQAMAQHSLYLTENVNRPGYALGGKHRRLNSSSMGSTASVLPPDTARSLRRSVTWLTVSQLLDTRTRRKRACEIAWTNPKLPLVGRRAFNGGLDDLLGVPS